MLHNSPPLSSALHLCSLLYITACTTALTVQVDSDSVNTSDRKTDSTVTVTACCGHGLATVPIIMPNFCIPIHAPTCCCLCRCTRSWCERCTCCCWDDSLRRHRSRCNYRNMHKCTKCTDMRKSVNMYNVDTNEALRQCVQWPF